MWHALLKCHSLGHFSLYGLICMGLNNRGVAQICLTALGFNIGIELKNLAVCHANAPLEVRIGRDESGSYTGVFFIATCLLSGHTSSSTCAGDTVVTFQGRSICQYQGNNKNQQQNLHHSWLWSRTELKWVHAHVSVSSILSCCLQTYRNLCQEFEFRPKNTNVCSLCALG